MPCTLGSFDPLKGIDIDTEIPGLDLERIKASEERKVAGDHQALDVVRVGVLPGVANRQGDAVHLRLTRPEEPGQRPVGAEMIALRVARHEVE